ncbi:chromate transporter [Ruminococcus sp. OA3]|uniref:chromate transporter n=1 Tax=Ruminococcus sp. OA3 TaxID=2914164 RepID=UPI001F06F1FF|nr:chromate transporter [Ruminococcus sp. OA3]MCH1982005.1 chromate transporter [Ruminococcus sp. OA3]
MRIWQLFMAFFQIGLFSIGGGYAVIPLIQEQVVASHGWVSQQTFTDIITISQMTPGPLAVNTSTFIGLQVAGIPGAVLATFGCVISGVVISSALYSFLKRHRKSVYVLEIFRGLKAASSGLIASAAVTILMVAFTGDAQWTGRSSIDWTVAAIFMVSLFCLKKWKLNPILVIVATGILGGLIR